MAKPSDILARPSQPENGLMLQAIKTVAIFAAISFLSLGLATALFPDSPLIGVVAWIALSAAYPLIKIGKLKATQPIQPETKSKPIHTEPAPSIEQDHEFKPWTEERLLWSGKRKLTIDYINSKNKRTTRDIDLLGIWPHSGTGEIYFRARCHLRDEWRTFKAENASNIQNARNKEFPDFFTYMSEELGI